MSPPLAFHRLRQRNLGQFRPYEGSFHNPASGSKDEASLGGGILDIHGQAGDSFTIADIGERHAQSQKMTERVDRMNRTVKDATVKRFHCDMHDQLQSHLADFVSAYIFAG